MSEEAERQHEVPYLHVRPPRRVVGVGGEGDRPVARITANRAGLLELRGQIDRALAGCCMTFGASYRSRRIKPRCVGNAAVMGGQAVPSPLCR